MNNRSKQSGFTLTEVLLAVATLVVGMIFVAGVFPVALYFSTIATERTTAAVTADEAFAKIKLYGIDFASLDPNGFCVDYNSVSRVPVPPDEFAYPSTVTNRSKQYYWSALCRQVSLLPENRLVQVTVFVSRKVGAGTRYWGRNTNGTLNSVGSSYPKPIAINIFEAPSLTEDDEIMINDINPTDGFDETIFIQEGGTIIDTEYGRLYRVLKRYDVPPNQVLLDKPWLDDIAPDMDYIFVVPPPIGGGRYPVIEVYQKLMRFELLP